MDKKDFDCVEVKRQAQEKLRQDYAGATDETERLRIAKELEESDDIVARKWRELKAKQDSPLRQAS